MQVDRPPAHPVPGAERIMTENEPLAVDRQFSVVLNARPPGSTCGVGRIIVADNEMLLAVELGEELLGKAGPLERKISKMPDFVFRRNAAVPVRDQGSIMVGHVREWTPIDAQHARVAEMGIACEINHSLNRCPT